MAHLMYSPPSDSHAGAECCPGRRIDNNLFITIQYLTMKMLPAILGPRLSKLSFSINLRQLMGII